MPLLAELCRLILQCIIMVLAARVAFADEYNSRGGAVPVLGCPDLADEVSEEQRRQAASKLAALHSEVEKHVRDADLGSATASLQQMIEIQTAFWGDEHWLTRLLRVSKSELDSIRGGDIILHPAYARCEVARAQGVQLYAQGDYKRASRLLLESLSLQSRVLGEDSFHYAVAAESYAHVQLGIGRAIGADDHYKTADAMFQRAADTYERLLNTKDPAYAGAIDGLGMVAMARGDFNRAEALISKAMRAHKDCFGSHSAAFALSLKHLAMVKTEKREYADAATAVEQALEICGTADSSAGLRNACLATKARLLAAKGDDAKAAELYDAAINFLQESISCEHPDLD